MSDDILHLDNYFGRDDNWFGSFDCPNCNQAWGPPDQGDPPVTQTENYRCDCGAILQVSGEWVSHYKLDVEQVDDEY